jgi:hypothetical protein
VSANLAAMSNNRAFTRDRPARDIVELIDFLAAEQPSKYMYRGQHTHYQNLIPSSFRGLTSQVAEREALVPVNRSAIDAWDKRRQAKFQVFDELIRRFGRAFGNLFSQQYGLSSEAIDLTDDIHVAAFFAARKYPDFAPYAPPGRDALGVIYRFPRVEQPPNLPRFELVLGMIGAIFTDLNVPGKIHGWFTSRVKSSHVVERQLEPFFTKFGRATGQLSTHAVVADASTLTRLYEELCQKQPALPRLHLGDTRIGRQFGGILRVPVHWRCSYANSLKLRNAPNTAVWLCDPPLAVMHDIIAIENGFYHPAIEQFFFRHRPHALQSSVTPQDLWPSRKGDRLFDWLCSFAEALPAVRAYVDQTSADIADPHQGIIDPGYVIA